MKKKSIIQLIILLIFISFWSILVAVMGTDRIVSYIGVENTYLVLAIVGILGGVSTFTSASFYTVLTTFASGGSNPFYLGLVGGAAVTVGDTLFYYIGKKGGESLPKKAKKITDRLSEWIETKPKLTIQLLTFAYTGLTPLPNDLITVPLGVTQYRYRNIILPLFLGNILLMTIVAVATSGIF